MGCLFRVIRSVIGIEYPLFCYIICLFERKLVIPHDKDENKRPLIPQILYLRGAGIRRDKDFGEKDTFVLNEKEGGVELTKAF